MGNIDLRKAIAPFLVPPPVAHDKTVAGFQRCAHAAPRADKGIETFEYYLGDVDVVCHIDYSPPERGSRERGTGLQMEPDYDERADVLAVYVRDVDIITMLSDDQVGDIETAFLEQDRSDF